MSIVLRPYQYRDVARIRAVYRSGKRAVLYVAPCGSGKTVLFAYIAQGANSRGNSVLVLCHRSELIDQISAALADQGVAHGFIAAGYRFERGHSVYVASVFTVVRRLAQFHPDLIIVDEAHHTSATTTWGQILSAYGSAHRLGVTATPWRATGEGLGSHFDEMVVGPDHEELINGGYLTPLKAFAPPTVDSAGLHTRLGEFVQSEVAERADRPAVTGDAIEHYRTHCPGKRAIVFDVSVDASRRRAAAFTAAGFPAVSIDGTLSRDIRAVALADFRSGRLTVLTSCDLVSEGFDVPSIEVGISLRPTQSLALWIQQTGRVLRPMAGKSVALLFDHTGNCRRHGYPTEPRDWSLSGTATGAQRAKPEPGVRVCAACFAVSRAGSKTCQACHEPFPVEPRTIAEKDGTLEELTPQQIHELRLKKAQAQEQGRAQSLPALIELGRMRGMKNPEGWAQHVLSARRAKGRG